MTNFNAGISTIFYTFMFYSLLKEDSFINNYKRQINKCGEVYNTVELNRIFSKAASPETGNEETFDSNINKFMYNIYISKISGRSSRFMTGIFEYPEHFVCKTLSFRINAFFLFYYFINNELKKMIEPSNDLFWSQFNPESFITKIENLSFWW